LGHFVATKRRRYGQTAICVVVEHGLDELVRAQPAI
jgi:hypothetical protein